MNMYIEIVNTTLDINIKQPRTSEEITERALNSMETVRTLTNYKAMNAREGTLKYIFESVMLFSPARATDILEVLIRSYIRDLEMQTRYNEPRKAKQTADSLIYAQILQEALSALAPTDYERETIKPKRSTRRPFSYDGTDSI